VISFVRGSVAAAGPDWLVVDVGPIGLRVTCTPAVALSHRVGDHVFLHTTLVVREDSWTTFGFETEEERSVFESVQTVTGIGPRIALAVLATLTPDALRQAIEAEDLATLTTVSGIGRKGAQRIVLELKGVLVSADPSSGRIAGVGPSWSTSVASGLTSLGWSAREADAAIAIVADQIPALTDPDNPDIGVLLKAALAALDRS
jgi:holliday junction DNA helicase RuvA